MDTEDVEHGLHGGFRVKLLESELELAFFEELVVEKVVDEVEEELGLRLDLRVVFLGSLLLFWGES